MATGVLRMEKPKQLRVIFTDRLLAGVTPKDMALHLIAAHGAGGAKGHVIEFAGAAVETLDMEGRMTLCNMATEFGAVGALIAPDAKTFDYLAGRRFAPEDFFGNYWTGLATDKGACYLYCHYFDFCSDFFVEGYVLF